MLRFFLKGCIVFFLSIILGASIPHSVWAAVSQSPTHFYNVGGDQGVSFHFHNTSGDSISDVDVYVDQTYLIMGNGSGSLGTCSNATRADDGNWHFSGCSIAPDATSDGSFPVVAVGGEYTGSDLTMNYTYGADSNTVSVTISGDGAPTATPEPNTTPTPTSASSSNSSSSNTSTTTVITVTKLITPTPTPTPLPDRTPPVVTILTDMQHAFTAAPTIEGKAIDPSGVSGNIEYSLDGGRNWILVDKVLAPNTPSTFFSFTPVGLLDDNYHIKVRTKDGKDNTGVTKQDITMIIDRLPPQVGVSVLTVGPQIIEPNGSGVYTTIAGLVQRITVSAIGGPISIQLSVGQDSVSLHKNAETGLWSGMFSLREAGDYELKSHAVDGAGNTTDRALGTVHVLSDGTITDNHGDAIKDAQVRIFYLDHTTNQFVLWDGKSYGEDNPQKTDEKGQYRVLLPKGTYYLRINKFGYQEALSSIFTVAETLPLTQSFVLLPGRSFRFGPFVIPLPDFRQNAVFVSSLNTDNPSASSVIGDEIPFFTFSNGNGTQVGINSLRGKPSVLVFVNSWYPQIATVVSSLETLATHTEMHVLVVVPQESDSAVSIFRARGAYQTMFTADPDGALISPLHLFTQPTYIFLNRNGVVQSVLYGVLSKEEVLHTLAL